MTLPRFFALALGTLAALAALVLALAVRTSGAAVVRLGESARVARARAVAAAVESELGAAEQAMGHFERAVAEGAVDVDDARSIARYLTAELIALGGLTELTLTAAFLEGYDDTGAARLAPQRRRRISVRRDGSGDIRHHIEAPLTAGGADDPIAHDTFRAAAHENARTHALWSDLAFAEGDGAAPMEKRRKILTVQKAIFVGDGTPSGHFVGVLRAGIVSETLDRLGAAETASEPHRTFLCDAEGRLITRLGPADPVLVVDARGRPDPDGDVRVVPRAVPAPIAAALTFARGGRTGGARMEVGETAYLMSLLPVAEGRAQQWRVGVVVPEDHYLGPLAAARRRLSVVLAVVVAATALVALAGVRAVQRGVGTLFRSTEAMRRFAFDAAPAVTSPFREVRAALESVERAKTALRAMVKYVPVDLVRRLYDSGRDPTVGAELMDVTLMFTDIADFTRYAEALPPHVLAEALGRYLEVATRAVERAGGTVDKYVGDALMVMWNAPVDDPQHPASACRAALACRAELDRLVTSVEWRAAGLPPWRTRFGIHSGRVLVGNFGAPERLSYTAIGDGVNLAARLEGLNKAYGTTILVSEDVRRRTGDGFVFRRVDRVAVKGKSQAVEVHELCAPAPGRPDLGERGAPL